MDLITLFTSYGLPGVIIGVLVYAIFKLFSRYDTAMETRITESRESIAALSDSADAIETNTRAIQALGDVVRAQQRRD